MHASATMHSAGVILYRLQLLAQPPANLVPAKHFGTHEIHTLPLLGPSQAGHIVPYIEVIGLRRQTTP